MHQLGIVGALALVGIEDRWVVLRPDRLRQEHERVEGQEVISVDRHDIIAGGGGKRRAVAAHDPLVAFEADRLDARTPADFGKPSERFGPGAAVVDGDQLEIPIALIAQ